MRLSVSWSADYPAAHNAADIFPERQQPASRRVAPAAGRTHSPAGSAVSVSVVLRRPGALILGGVRATSVQGRFRKIICCCAVINYQKIGEENGLKLRPYGAIQINLFIIVIITTGIAIC